MKPLRLSALLVLAGLLVACDDPPAPKAPPTPPPPVVQPATPAPSKAEAPAATAPSTDSADKPVVATEKKPAVSSAPKPKPAPKPAKDVVLPPAKLDLRLPKELVEEIEPSEVLSEQPVLPPMFVDKTPEVSPFELNGRILTNEQAGDDSVQGAELQFKFRN